METQTKPLDKFVARQKQVLEIMLERLAGSKRILGPEIQDGAYDLVDIGTAVAEADQLLLSNNNTQAIKKDVIAALKRIEQGTYGICEYSGKTISEARLEAIPWCRYSIETQQELEKRGRHGGRNQQFNNLFDDAFAEVPDDSSEMEEGSKSL
jgi:RNA polymerase-binding transcription factor DksA